MAPIDNVGTWAAASVTGCISTSRPLSAGAELMADRQFRGEDEGSGGRVPDPAVTRGVHGDLRVVALEDRQEDQIIVVRVLLLVDRADRCR
jgi:hypothetical protein